MNEIMGNVVAGLAIVICVATGIWAWWIENGPAPKDKSDKRDDSSEEHEDGEAEVDKK